MMELWKAAGAAAWGAVGFGGLLPFLSESAQKAILHLCPNPGGVFVAAFPYFAGNGPGNLSLYCRGEDYHHVVRRRLETVCQALRDSHPGHTFLPGADNSPLPEIVAARLAGVGIMGAHGLLLVPPYGSYVFLGTILTTLPLPTPDTPAPACEGCGACRTACPTGALGEEGFCLDRCLSHLTQKKGDLTDREAAWIRNSPTVWGCDLCQRACPYNRNAALTPLPEFREDLIPSLSLSDVEGLTNRTFRDQYGKRAFAWRGPAPLKRNLGLHRGKK